MDEELNSIERNKALFLRKKKKKPLPIERRPIVVEWVYKIKMKPNGNGKIAQYIWSDLRPKASYPTQAQYEVFASIARIKKRILISW